MPYTARDGVRLYYEQQSREDSQLLFLHGWCCDHTFYEPQYEHFKSSYTVTALDLRGCGASDCPEDGYDIPSLSDEVAWFCDDVGITKPIVVGHSLGGMIALELAAHHPSLPRAVVADDPGPVYPTEVAVRTYEEFAAQLAGPAGEAARRAWVEDGVGPTADDDLRGKIVATMCAVPLAAAAAVIRGVTAWNGVSALRMCSVPLLLLASAPGGSNDPSRLAQLKPDAWFGMTVGAGHFHQLEVPEQVTSMIERFIETAVAN